MRDPMVFIKDKEAIIHYLEVISRKHCIIFPAFQVHLHLTLLHNKEIILQLVLKIYL